QGPVLHLRGAVRAVSGVGRHGLQGRRLAANLERKRGPCLASRFGTRGPLLHKPNRTQDNHAAGVCRPAASRRGASPCHFLPTIASAVG
ncbi:hypothetical protein ABTE39_19380, partial [Acinetobacter baumannii]